MSKFNEYATRLDSAVKSYGEEYQSMAVALEKAEAARKETPIDNRIGVSHKYAAKAARIEAAYQDARAAFDTMKKQLPDAKRQEIANIRSELEEAVNTYYAADSQKIDMATVELLKSGILRSDEYERLMDKAEDSGNTTMMRMIGVFAGKRLDEYTKGKGIGFNDDTATALRMVKHRADTATGQEHLEMFDTLVRIFDRIIQTPAMMRQWERLSADAIASF